MNNLTQTGGINDKVRTTLAELKILSVDLRNALITKNVTKIWEILPKQQEKMLELEQYGFLWKDLFANNDTNEEMNAVKSDIMQEAREVKQLGESNISLSRSFLGVINRVLVKTGTETAISKSNKVYGRRGKMNYKKTSRILNKIG